MDGFSERAMLRQQFADELTGNILPLWMAHAVDAVNGGFHGAVSNDLQVDDTVPRGAILCARILWTYSAAYRVLGGDGYLRMARHAFDALIGPFWDDRYGGVYWSVDASGRPVLDRKHHYAQGFAIYGLSEYHRATGDSRARGLAQQIFGLLEAHGYDPVRSGYIEASSRDWSGLVDMRLSEKDLDARKSMNTLLHLLEAYTNLLRVWEDARLRAQHRALIETFLTHVIDPQTGHFRLFFDDDWRSLSPNVSYGHDIEGSWLLVEAAVMHDDPALRNRVTAAALRLAEGVLREGRDADGSLFEATGPGGLIDASKSWWAQAEGMVGFTNAYQLTGNGAFAEVATTLWAYCQAHLIDHQHGGWFKQLHRDGSPDLTRTKIGPWDCPYHHSRACLEMMARLSP